MSQIFVNQIFLNASREKIEPLVSISRIQHWLGLRTTEQGRRATAILAPTLKSHSCRSDKLNLMTDFVKILSRSAKCLRVQKLSISTAYLGDVTAACNATLSLLPPFTPFKASHLLDAVDLFRPDTDVSIS